MKTITESVESILRQSPHLSEALAEGIVNYTALARNLKPELQEEHLKSFTEGAVVMALKRLEKATAPSKSHRSIASTVQSINLRSNPVEHAFRNSPNLQRVQERLLKAVDGQEDLYVYFTRGTFDTAIIVSDSLEEKLKQFAEGETCVKKFRNLSLISIRFKPEITEIPGVYYPFFQSLAWKGISFVQVMTGFAELAFLFDDKDVDRAFSVIKSVTKPKAQQS